MAQKSLLRIAVASRFATLQSSTEWLIQVLRIAVASRFATLLSGARRRSPGCGLRSPPDLLHCRTKAGARDRRCGLRSPPDLLHLSP